MQEMHQTKPLQKKRDQRKTKKLLIDTVRKILIHDGYTHFNLKEISTKARLDPKMIRYHFGSLNNLLKTYIHEQNFWMPEVKPFGAADDLKTSILKLLKNQLDRFRSCPEMQAFILWQLSAYHPVISRVVKLRDTEAIDIIGMDQQTAPASGIPLNALLAVLTGAMYALVLQSKTGNGPVWGLDISREDDYKVLMETISRILDLVLDTE